MQKPTLLLVAPMALPTNSQIGMVRRNMASAHQQRRKDGLIEAHKAYNLERFAANCTCKSLSAVYFQDEMDLIVDKDNHAILTMIERSTNFLLMPTLKYGKKAMPLAKTVWRLLLPYKGDKLLTITTDNGSEFAEHEWISKHLGGVLVYFTDSYSSWQKGAVENTNKLIRQYIPKGTNINTITDTLITKIQKKINRRPREKLNFSTPVKELYKHYS